MSLSFFAPIANDTPVVASTRSTCAYCAKGDCWACRADRDPCACAKADHPNRINVGEAEARRRLAHFAAVLRSDGEKGPAELVEKLLHEFDPQRAWRLIFESQGAEHERRRTLLPPFNPDQLAPRGAKAVLGAHRARRPDMRSAT